MTEILGFEIPIDFGGFLSGSFMSLILYIIIFVIFLIFMGLIVYMFFQWKLYNKKIVVFENTGEGFRLVHKDKARLVKVGDGGEEVLFLKNKKVYRSAYGRKMGHNEYWFCIGQDGYWYNVVLGDLDAKMGMLDIEPIDRDMRYMHVAMRKNAQERYNKVKFWDKYGVMMMSMGFLVIVMVGLWFLIDQIGQLLEQSANVANVMSQSIDVIKESLARVDVVQSGGSGLSPA